VDEFDYDLPRELIAQTPAEPRDAARLLVFDRSTGSISHMVFRDLISCLPQGSVLVFNQTKVEPRRLYGEKARTFGKVEVLLLDCLAEDRWECKMSPGMDRGGVIIFTPAHGQKGGASSLEGHVIEVTPEGNRIIEFSRPVREVWGEYGVLPIPPYIKGYHGDEQRYQTVYARAEGSVAAPTAGLHFTEELISQVKRSGHEVEFVTLHVSRDTAFPIMKEETVDQVRVHSENVIVTPEVSHRLNEAKRQGRRIIAVGTTSVRTLEGISRRTGSQALLPEEGYSGAVDLFIHPGFEFGFVDSMITNFHFPRSTLFMLICAFGGRQEMQKVYREAVEERYRFFTFGDAMLIL